jgi:hypothetical protein
MGSRRKQGDELQRSCGLGREEEEISDAAGVPGDGHGESRKPLGLVGLIHLRVAVEIVGVTEPFWVCELRAKRAREIPVADGPLHPGIAQERSIALAWRRSRRVVGLLRSIVRRSVLEIIRDAIDRRETGRESSLVHPVWLRAFRPRVERV